MDSAIRVFLVDDHPVVRVGLGALINKQKDLTVSGEVATGREVLSALSEYPTDVLVADLALADMNGLEVVKQVRGEYPDMPILVLSMHDERLFAERALRAGANGYIMKDTAPHVYQAILVDRNTDWANQIETLLQGSGTAFIAVGAAHLAGDDSVQALLAQRGVDVTRVAD